MKMREATGADCVWYQEQLQQGKTPNCVQVVARMFNLDEETVMNMPAKEVWPRFRQAQDAIAEGFPADPTD